MNISISWSGEMPGREFTRTIKYFRILVLTAFIIFLERGQLPAQQLQGKALADSFLNELPRTKIDTDQVKLIISAARVMRTIDPPSAIKYLDSAMHLSRQHKWEKGVGLSYLNKARTYRFTSDFASALDNASKAYEVFAPVNWKQGMGESLSEVSNIYEARGNYSKAIENNFKALGIYEQAGADRNIAWTYNNIGVDYYRLANYPKSLENYNKALVTHKKTGDKYGLASVLDNMASVYKELGEFGKVNRYNLEAIQMFEEINDQPAMGRIYINRGNFLQDQKNFDSALIYYNKAIAIATKLGIKKTLAYGNGGIGELHFTLAKKGNSGYIVPAALKISRPMLLQKAFDYFSTALKFSEDVGDLSLLKDYSMALSETEALRGNYQSALNLYKQSTINKDSIFNEENERKIAALENERLAEVKDKEIQLQALEHARKEAESTREANIQYFAIAVLAIIVLAVVFVALIQYRNSKHRQLANAQLQQQKEKVETTLNELQSTQAQLIQSEKMASLGQLTAGIAHEIQNPLNFVNNFSEMNVEMITEIKNEILAGNKQEALTIANDIHTNAAKIIHHGKRADAIVKSMLQHSRTNTGQKELTDINALADEYLRLSYHGIRAKSKSHPDSHPEFVATLKTDFDASIGKVNVVPQNIGRVLLNIYNNAFYAVQGKAKTAGESYVPTVSVNTMAVDNNIEIHVTDNGTGIPEKVLDKIFLPFFTTKHTGQATGLGLSLSYDMIKAIGGEILVETKEGEGTTFRIRFPFENAETTFV